MHAHRGHVPGLAIELDEPLQRLVVGRRTVEREVERALGTLGISEPLLEDPRDAMQMQRALVGILGRLDESLARAECELPLAGLRREVRQPDERVFVVGLVAQCALERLQRHRWIIQAIRVEQTQAIEQRREYLRIALEPCACEQRIGGLLPIALLPRDVRDRRVRA